jgi:hypothetical protein
VLLEAVKPGCGDDKHLQIDVWKPQLDGRCDAPVPIIPVAPPTPEPVPILPETPQQTIATPIGERTPTVFVSYSRRNEAIAKRLIADLNTAGHEDLYAILERSGYYWDSSDQCWHQGDERSRAQGKFSGFIFEDADGLPTGVFKLRVMANETEIATVCAEISRAIVNAGISVIEVSDKSYPNHW